MKGTSRLTGQAPADDPARARTKPGVIQFVDFDRAAVYHCHVLDQEDQGMMGLIDAR